MDFLTTKDDYTNVSGENDVLIIEVDPDLWENPVNNVIIWLVSRSGLSEHLSCVFLTSLF